MQSRSVHINHDQCKEQQLCSDEWQHPVFYELYGGTLALPRLRIVSAIAACQAERRSLCQLSLMGTYQWDIRIMFVLLLIRL